MRFKPTGDVEINVGVLVNNNEVLWEFRDFLIGLGTEADYKVSMMLAKDQETILRVMSFISGGFDIVIVADKLPSAAYFAFVDKALKRNNEVRILFQIDKEIEFVDECHPHIIFVSNRERLKSIIKEEIGALIKEKITKENQNE